jgi:hypothetical protein
MRNVGKEFHRIALSFWRYLRCFRSLRAVQADLSQGAHAHQVVGRHHQDEHLVHALESTPHHLANAADIFGIAEPLFDQLVFALGQRVSLALRNGLGHGRFAA